MAVSLIPASACPVTRETAPRNGFLFRGTKEKLIANELYARRDDKIVDFVIQWPYLSPYRSRSDRVGGLKFGDPKDRTPRRISLTAANIDRSGACASRSCSISSD